MEQEQSNGFGRRVSRKQNQQVMTGLITKKLVPGDREHAYCGKWLGRRKLRR